MSCMLHVMLYRLGRWERQSRYCVRRKEAGRVAASSDEGFVRDGGGSKRE